MEFKILIFAVVFVMNVRAENSLDAQNRLNLMHMRRYIPLVTASSESSCGCTTLYSTFTGEGFLYSPPTPSIPIEPIAEPTSEYPPVIETSCPPPVTVTITETKYITIPGPVSTDIIDHEPIHLTSTLETPALISSTVLEPPLAKPTLSIVVPAEPTPAVTIPTAPHTGSLGSTNGMWAITFSPFNDDGKCKSAATVWSDVKMIRAAGFKSIRVYGTECSGIENISSAASFHGMKLIIGIFISETGCNGAADQVTHITKWGKWDLVELIVIGNEALFSGHTSPDELAGFISSTKTTLRSAGYAGPCTTAEPLNIWEKNSAALCDAVDIVGCNIHPFFNPEIDASRAGPFVKSQLEIVDKICPGKRGINLECGWPSAGECNGKACPGKSEQEAAVASIQSFAGNTSVMFTYTDDYWKTPGPFHVEQKFGLIKLLMSH